MSVKLEKFGIEFSQDLPFVLISGPCQIESRDHAMMMASRLQDLTSKHNVPFVFKASFDKANRTSLSGKRGSGIDEGLRILSDVSAELNVPVITDVHSADQCEAVAQAVDILQIPAFLCRQTDLLIAVANTQKTVMIKKGQFLAPSDMKHVAQKVTASGNARVLLCERGASFGYNNLVSDMRSLPIMASTGHPVIFDATHSTQMPGGLNGASGGDREMAPVLARAALAVGIAGLFVEAHDAPETAPSDAAVMMRIDELANHLGQWKALDGVVKLKI